MKKNHFDWNSKPNRAPELYLQKEGPHSELRSLPHHVCTYFFIIPPTKESLRKVYPS